MSIVRSSRGAPSGQISEAKLVSGLVDLLGEQQLEYEKYFLTKNYQNKIHINTRLRLILSMQNPH